VEKDGKASFSGETARRRHPRPSLRLFLFSFSALAFFIRFSERKRLKNGHASSLATKLTLDLSNRALRLIFHPPFAC